MIIDPGIGRGAVAYVCRPAAAAAGSGSASVDFSHSRQFGWFCLRGQSNQVTFLFKRFLSADADRRLARALFSVIGATATAHRDVDLLRA